MSIIGSIIAGIVVGILARLVLPVLAIAVLTVNSSGLPRALTEAAVGGTVSSVALIAVFAAVLASPRAAAAVGRFFDRVLAPLRRSVRQSVGHVVRLPPVAISQIR